MMNVQAPSIHNLHIEDLFFILLHEQLFKKCTVKNAKQKLDAKSHNRYVIEYLSIK